MAAKYLNDSSPKNKHWATFAKLFDTAEINLMEKQLLFLLDYDLRFDEAEAIAHFAHFMPKRSEAAMETRAAAVTRAKARVQAHIARPLTPPQDVAPPPEYVAVAPAPAATGVQNLVKRLSTTYLTISSGNNSGTRCRSLSRASSSSTLGTASASGDSESGSQTSSSACSSPATSVSSHSDQEIDLKDCPMVDVSDKKFIVGAVPPYASRQGRKVSTASTCTIRGDKASVSPSTSSKRISLEAELRTGMGRGSGKRTSLGPNQASVGFLSRMFGTGAKSHGQDKDKDSADQSEAPAPGPLRRLASKSTLF